MARLKDYYRSEVAPALMKKFEYKSPMQIPKLDKVVINIACGDAKDNSKVIDSAMADLAVITGQHPVVCKARKSVANFKLRKGMPIGVKVTLRGDRMYEFIDRLFNFALPRVRDFRGINAEWISCSLQRQPRTKKQKNFLLLWARRLRNKEATEYGKESYDFETAEACQIHRKSIQQMQDLRQTSRLSQKIRYLPYLLP